MKDIPKNDEEWKERLSEDEYHVLRKGGTEAPFSGKLLDIKEKGMFQCAGCGANLFSSNAKFDSGTGWPSFEEALPGAVSFHKDDSFGIHRTEVRCAKCRSHLGHVFDDGPKDTTGKRYCINSTCLDFQKEK